jgi:DNA-directed RNA polymerase
MNLELKEKNQNTLSLEIARNLLLELKSKILKEEQPAWMFTVNKNIRTSNQEFRNRMIDFSMRYFKNNGIYFNNEMLDMDKSNQIKLGAYFMNLIVSNSSYFEFKMKKKYNRYQKVLTFTDKFIEQISIVDKKFSTINSKYRPMILKPKPHNMIIGGGYLTNEDTTDLNLKNIENLKTKFIRTNSKEQLKENNKGNLDFIYKQVNTVQETPFIVNNEVLNVINELVKNDIEVKNKNNRTILFKKSLLELPNKNDFDLDNKEELELYKEKAHNVHVYNASIVSEKSVQFIKINLANEFVKKNEFYYPHNLDSRGRLYPIPVLFTTQSDDFGKSLLKFKRKKKLGEQGITWLFINLANNYGEDKLDLIDREDWVLNNLEMIRNVANNPIKYIDYWRIADKPFQFLAFCIEVNNMYNFKEQGNNEEDYLCSIPAGIDATNSGTQHYAAMLRDEYAGKLVNLTYEDEIQDIYKEVSDNLKKDLENIKEKIRDKKGFLITNEEYEYAVMWLNSGLINRKLTKRPTMTKSYGVSSFGVHEQTIEYLIEINANEKYYNNKSVSFIAKYILSNINKTIKSAAEGMNYFQDLTKLLANNDISIKYKTPLNFIMYNNYKKQDIKKVKTHFGSMIFNNSFSKPNKDNELNTSKNVNGIAPNIIHSLDATHMFMVINEAKKQGIDDFLMIHDSFSVHPSDLELLNKIVREEFVKLYKNNDIIDDFKNQLIELIYKKEFNLNTTSFNELKKSLKRVKNFNNINNENLIINYLINNKDNKLFEDFVKKTKKDNEINDENYKTFIIKKIITKLNKSLNLNEEYKDLFLEIFILNKEEIIQNIKNDLLNELDLIKKPSFGNLNLDEVLKSKFFFN